MIKRRSVLEFFDSFSIFSSDNSSYLAFYNQKILPDYFSRPRKAQEKSDLILILPKIRVYSRRLTSFENRISEMHFSIFSIESCFKDSERLFCEEATIEKLMSKVIL